MNLNQKISQLRNDNNWSQEELAEKLNVSRQSVSKWESGQAKPDLDKIIALSNIFDVSTDYLLKDIMKKKAIHQLRSITSAFHGFNLGALILLFGQLLEQSMLSADLPLIIGILV